MRLATRAWCVSSASALYASSRARPRLARTMATWVDADEAATVQTNVQAVRERVNKISETATLIAVSKLKPLSHVKAAFDAGQRDFGENYVQELAEKAEAAKDVEGLRWHFIGSLQSNKVRQLCQVPQLACVHTVERAKIANSLDRVWGELGNVEPLACFLQVNTSGEETKGGCAPDAAPELAKAIHSKAHLKLVGLMCIGKYSGAEGDASPDFNVLRSCRDAAAAELGVSADTLALSMGMSHDFEQALGLGATHVRVGSTIFGARPPKK